MKFSIPSKTLLSLMASVGKVVNPKSPVAILSNFLIELEGDTLTVSGTDQDTVITRRVGVEGSEGSGRFCLDAKRILELLRAMPDSVASFDIDDESLAVVIRYLNGQYDLMAQKGDDYPMEGYVDESRAVVEFEMPSAQVTKCLDRVAFAVGKDDFKPAMQGILWDIREDAIVFVATDTRQLAKYRCTQTAPGSQHQFILTGKAAQMLCSTLGKDATVKVSVTDRSVHFTSGDFIMRSSLINGRFPQYDRVIPTDNDKTITVDRATLLNAVRRVALCADTQNSLIKLEVSPSSILITSQDLSFSVGGRESVPCEFTGAEKMLIGFASGYLCNILDALTTGTVSIRLKDGMRPGLFLPAENDEFGELTLLCMPLAIERS